MYINIFYNYAVHIIIPKNAENGEPELNNSGDKPQYNNELVIHNNIINETWKKYWYNSGISPSLPVQLENVTWMNLKPLYFLEEII